MKKLIFMWLITLFVDNLLPLVLARPYPNYKHKEMALSVLGSRQSPAKWIHNVWCIIWHGAYGTLLPRSYGCSSLSQNDSGNLRLPAQFCCNLFDCCLYSRHNPGLSYRQERRRKPWAASFLSVDPLFYLSSFYWKMPVVKNSGHFSVSGYSFPLSAYN